jgi:AbrB family looped-hinge helix DNA binding protein
MLAEIRAKSQITLPKPLVEGLGLSVGDLLDISERDGGIFMMPVVITPKQQAVAPKRSQNERREILRALFGSIEDPTMVEPPEPGAETQREAVL